jgi:hypothetical protein
MTHVWHLVRNDLRAHHRLLLAWLAIVVAQPLVTAVAWWGALDSAVAWGPLSALVVVRIGLAGALVAMLVQGDSPIDDRAFWRTRPISPTTLAVAKLLLVVGIFVVAPMAVVLMVAAWVKVPVAHWPATLVQVFVMEAALAGLSLSLSTRTRSVAGLLLLALGSVVGFSMLLGSLQELRRVTWLAEVVKMADPRLGIWPMLTVAVIGFATVFVVGYHGWRRRHAFAVAALLTLLGPVSVLFLPQLQIAPPSPLPLGLRFVDTPTPAVRAERLPGNDRRVALIVEPVVTGRHDRDETRVFTADGTLQLPDGTERRTESSETPGLNAAQLRSRAAVLAILDAGTFATLRGQRVRFIGRLKVDVTRHDTEATAALEPGAILDTPHLRLVVGTVFDDRARPSGERRWARAEALELHLQGLVTTWRHGHTYLLRDDATGCEVTVQPYSADRGLRSVLLPPLLPTLAQPFTAWRVRMTQMLESECDVDVRRSIIELRMLESPPPSTVLVNQEFTVPDASPRRDTPQ